MRNTYMAIGLSTWVAAVLDMAVALGRAVAGDRPLTPVFASGGRGILGQPEGVSDLGRALLGVGAHFVLMAMIAAVFVLAVRRFASVGAHPWISGAVYGLMLYLVLPLHGEASGPGAIALEIFVHFICVGLPIALISSALLRPAPVAPRLPVEPTAP